MFDTLKAEVDEKRWPGRFAISGSTEFSKKTGIFESLTGRVALLRLFPLSISEIAGSEGRYPLSDAALKFKVSQAVSLNEISLWLDRGGMPGIFAIGDTESRLAQFQNWIETTCSRDLAQFKIPRFDPELARRILIELARVETPTRLEIANVVGCDPRSITPYLDGFKALFVIYEIPPDPNGIGKSIYLLFDAGIAEFLGASLKRRLQIWFLNECFSQFAYSGQMRPDLFTYRSARSSCIDFIVETITYKFAVICSERESPHTYQIRPAIAFRKKFPKVKVIILAPCSEVLEIEDQIYLVPWNAVV